MKIANEDGSIKRSYRKWSSMLRRCSDKKHPSYHRYGGRGITVCERWSNESGYANFVEDMGETPDGLTLERKDGDKPYEKDNCQWVPLDRRGELRNGAGAPRKPRSLRGRARGAGIPYMVVYQRIHTLGWPIARALREPAAARGSKSIMQKAAEKRHADASFSAVRPGVS